MTHERLTFEGHFPAGRLEGAVDERDTPARIGGLYRRRSLTATRTDGSASGETTAGEANRSTDR